MIRSPPTTIDEYLARYPRLCAALIANSAGHFTPREAARVVQRAHDALDDDDQWVEAFFGGNARGAVEFSVYYRHRFLCDLDRYDRALTFVRTVLSTGRHPACMSWAFERIDGHDDPREAWYREPWTT